MLQVHFNSFFYYVLYYVFIIDMTMWSFSVCYTPRVLIMQKEDKRLLFKEKSGSPKLSVARKVVLVPTSVI